MDWKQAGCIILLVEAFFFSIGVFIHEMVHSISFYLISGRFGEIHLFDSIAYRCNTYAVCVPPKGVIIQDTFLYELIAYAVTFLVTGLFLIIILRWADSSKVLKLFLH